MQSRSLDSTVFEKEQHKYVLKTQLLVQRKGRPQKSPLSIVGSYARLP